MGLHKVLKGKVANLEILYSVNMPFKRKEAINRQNVQSVFFFSCLQNTHFEQKDTKTLKGKFGKILILQKLKENWQTKLTL